MKFLANPVVLRLALVFIFAAALLLAGVWVMRRLRRQMLATKFDMPTPRVDNAAMFATAAFQGVLQQMKAKEQTLERLRQAAEERAAASENLTATVLTNLDTGVVIFNTVGLGQSANAAAREILGYATVSGMHPRDLFRGVNALRAENGSEAPREVAEALERALRDVAVFRRMRAEYVTPAGAQRKLAITIAPALGNAGECLGAVCLLALADSSE